jgi:uncharacterized protein
MAFDWQNRSSARPATWADVDAGLRQHMLRVYNYMAGGLALTGAVAWLASTPQIARVIYGTPLMWVVMLAPLGLVFFLSFRIQSMSLGAAQATFWSYSALMGLSLGFIFLVYTGASIFSTFFITAATFLGMSLYGYTTRRDLTGMGAFMMMGLWGIIVASLVSMVLAMFGVPSSALQFAISIVGVVVFTGLTAYDTQVIKEIYFAGDDQVVAGKKAIMGALRLYLDFINLFLMLLRLMGQRR